MKTRNIRHSLLTLCALAALAATEALADNVSVPADFAVTGVDTTKVGFLIRPYQTDGSTVLGQQPNCLAWTEDQLIGLHGPNLADLSGATDNGFYTETGVINYSIEAGTGTDRGNFPGDQPFPGIPGTMGTTGDATMEVLTFLEFPAAGTYQMGVNSDDGFKVTTANNPRDRFATVLGEFDGARFSADTLFSFTIAQPGFYPFRLIWENGNGELSAGNLGNCEWFMVQPDDTKVLINSGGAALKAYYSGPALPPFVSRVVPGINEACVPTNATVEVNITDGGSSTVNPNTISLSVNGAAVTPNVTKAGPATTVSYTPPGSGWPLCAVITNVLRFADSAGLMHTDSWTFNVQCPANKTVLCGTNWDFDPPVIGGSSGSSNVTFSILSTVTNSGPCPWVITRTWLFTDVCGNTNTCSQTVTVEDTTPPALTCAANKTVACGTAWSFDAPTASDACCTNVTLQLLSSNLVSSILCQSVYQGIWRATDCCTNYSTCTQTVTVASTLPPIVNVVCVTNVYYAGGGNNFTTPVPSSPSAGLLARFAGDTFKEFDQCTVNSFFIDTFSNLNLSSCNITSATLTMRLKPCGDIPDNDAMNLSFTGANGVLVPDSDSWGSYIGSGNGSPGLPGIGAWGTYTSGQVITLDLGHLPNTGLDLIPDLNQNGFLDFELEDDTGVDYLQLTVVSCCCSTNKTVECGSGWTFDTPSAVDACSGARVPATVLSTVTNSGPCPWVITRTWLFTDACGNTNTCSQTVTVEDTTPPVLTCAANKTVPCGTAWNFDAPTASDTCCTNVTVQLLSSNLVSSTRCQSVYQGIWRATDCCTNYSTCTQTVTVASILPPIVNVVCVTNVYFAGGGNNFTTPVPSSPSAGLLQRYTTAGVTSFKQFDECTVNSYFIDTFNNLPPCITSATLTMRLKPCGDIPDNDAMNLSFTGAGGALVPGSDSWGSYIGSGNGSPGLPGIGAWGTYTSGQVITLDLGHLPNTGLDLIPDLNQNGFLDFELEDDTGVDYLQLTVVSCCCSTNKTVECGSVWTFDTPSAVDACSGARVSATILSTVTNSGPCPWVITRTWLFTDVCGNTNTCSQTVTVEDTTPPVLTCAANKTVPCGTAWNFDAPTASDACCTNVTLQLLSSNLVSSTRCQSVYQGIWRATDCCSNTATCSQTVTVASTLPPVLNGVCVTNVYFAGGSNNFTTPVSSSPSAGLLARFAGDTFKEFDQCTVNSYFIDTFSNLPSCITSATLTMRLKPCGDIPDNDAMNLSFTGANGVLVPDSDSWGSYIGSGNGSPGLPGIGAWGTYTSGQVITLDLGHLPNTGLDLIPDLNQNGFLDFELEDDTGVDYLQLTVVSCCCSTNKTVECGSVWTFDTPSAVDACSGAPVPATVLSTVTNSGPCPWVITRTWLFTDGCGNTNTCSQTVTVEDTTPPVLTCAANKTVPCGTAWNFDAPTASDTCCTNVTVQLLSSNLVSSTRCQSVYQGTWLATDCCSNAATCSQTVTVASTLPPVLNGVCVTNVYFTGGSNNFTTLVPSSPSAGLLQRCTTAGVTSFKQFDECTVNSFFIDTFNNLPSCITSATLTMRLKPCGEEDANDEVGLSFTGANGQLVPGSWSRFIGAGNASAGLLPNSWDTSTYPNGLVFTLDLANLPTAAGGTESLLSSMNGNGFLDFTLEDDTGVDYLQLTVVSCCCSTNKTVECGSVWTFDTPSAVDACSGARVSATILSTVTNSGPCPWVITRTWLFTDVCGNTNTCSQTVTVEDTTPPVLTCAANKTVPCGTAWNFDAPTASDACCTNVTLQLLSSNLVSSTRCQSVYQGIWRVTDCCTNYSTCTQTVTVASTLPPVLNGVCVTNVYFAGGSNNFTTAVPSSPSAGLLARFADDTFKEFDQCTVNSVFIDTFSNLPSCITSATLTMRLKPCGNIPDNDAMNLSFTGAGGALVPGSDSWGSYIGSGNGSPGLPGIGAWGTYTSGQVITLDLGHLPNTGLDLIPDLNQNGFLDFELEDDTGVDYLQLTVVSCCCSTNKTVECGSGWTFDTPSAVDACSGAPVPATVLSTVTNSGPCPWVITRTWLFTDVCGNTNTCSQTVTVEDTTPPTVLATDVDCTSNKVCITFNKTVDPVSASNPANYSISPGVTLNNAVLGPPDTVCLLTTQLAPGITYTLAINGVRDLCGNVMAATNLSFTCTNPCVAPVITSQPQDQTVSECRSVTFSVTASGTPPLGYQWFQNGVAKSGANGSSCTDPFVTLADNGAQFYVVVTNACGSVTSRVAVLTVVVDTTPPTLLSAAADCTSNTVCITFSEPLDPVTANNAANYSIDSGVTVSAVLVGPPDTVCLNTSQLTPGVTYTLTVNGVKDLCGNAIASHSQITFACPTNDCLATNVVLNTGFNQPAGPLYSIGDSDSFWTVVGDPDPGTTEPRPATVIQANPAWKPAEPNSQWISSYGSSANPTNGVYEFRTQFCLETNYHDVTLSLCLRADDSAEVFLTNQANTPVSILTTPSSSFNTALPTCGAVTSTTDPSLFHVGINYLVVRVHNEYGVAMGLNLTGTVTGSGLWANRPDCCWPYGSIVGQKFNDLNGNGAWDPGEPALPGCTINLTSGPGAPQSAVTDVNGYYYFMDLPPGSYTVSEAQQPGWMQTAPAGGSYTVTLGTAQSINGLNFGNRLTLIYPINIQPGFNLIANQLDQGGNSLNEIMPVVPDGCALYKYDNALSNWSAANYSAALGSWMPGDITLSPGEGAFLQSPTNFSLTFTGSPHVPVLPVTIPAGACYLLSYQTNAVATPEEIVGTNLPAQTLVYKWTGSAYQVFTKGAPAGGWIPSAPTTAVGEAVWIAPAGGLFTPPPAPVDIYITPEQWHCVHLFNCKDITICSPTDVVVTCPVTAKDMCIFPAQSVIVHSSPILPMTVTPGTAPFTVYCWADNGYGGTVSCSFTVTVVEGQPQALDLYNTGVNDNNDPLNNGDDDLHYLPPSGPNFVAVDNSAPVMSAWLANSLSSSPYSRWIAPQENGLGAANTSYTYRQTFHVVCSTDCVVINGRWAVDNSGAILLNGSPIPGGTISGNIQANFKTWHPFTITSGFVPGANNLDFVVTNYASYTGLRVEMSGTECCCSNTFSGMKFNDLNGDGVWQSNEPLLAGVTIYAYQNSIQVANTVTGANGQYHFTLPCGTYTLMEASMPGWVQTCPSSGYYVVTSESGPYERLNFGNYPSPVPLPKFVQWPDQSPNGLDVNASLTNILADDFLCTSCGPITNIQIWGSWLSDKMVDNPSFTLGIWSDVPAQLTQPPIPSHPGDLLWSAWFGPPNYNYSSAFYANASEHFYDPNIAGLGGLVGGDTEIWRYSFNPLNPFWQTGSSNSPVFYWLSVSAEVPTNVLFGWKTSTNHWNDDAVYGHLNTGGVPMGDWKELRDPRTNNSLNLSFLLNSGPCTNCEAKVDIHCPSNIVAYSPPPYGPVPVPFTVSASSTCAGPVTVVCTPSSGSLFPVGTTVVHCVATDDCGCSASCDFLVTVANSPPPQLPIRPTAGGYVVSWPVDQGWILQRADSVIGPWAVVSTVTNSYLIIPTKPNQFYRLKLGP
jgi:hypothetical protein